MSKLKILLFAQYGKMGGTRTYFKQLLNLYSKLGARVTILRTFEDNDPEIDERIIEYGFTVMEAVNGFGHRHFGTRFPLHIFREWVTYRKLVLKVSPDIIVISVGLPKLFIGVLPMGRKSLYILHTSPQDSQSEPKWKRMVVRFAYGLFFCKTSWLITVSDHARKSIAQAWAVPKDTLHVVYSTMGDVIHADENIQHKARIVLTLGHVVHYKNPFGWIKIAKQVLATPNFSDVQFVWAGEGDLLEDCRNAVSAEGLEHTINFLGLKQEVATYYRLCTVYFQPSYIETLGLSVLDAMRNGRPCIVSNRGGLPEVVEDGVCGWVVNPDDLTLMSKKLCALLSDVELQARMGEAAKSTYAKRFNAQAWERRMADIHMAIMEEESTKWRLH